SPVGELEDIGQLTEDEAMRHPRHNEVFRDVGSRLRGPHEEEFIEIKTVRFRPDAALLICSDGLSDVLTAARIGAIVESYDGDPQALIRALSVARPGDTVEVPPGEFLGPIELKEGVNLIGRTPGQTVLRAPDGGIALVARGIRSARVAGLRIVGGILVSGSAV